MKCICEQRHQLRIKGVAVMFKPGMVRNFKKCPPHWRALKDVPFSFAAASADELKNRDWSVAELREEYPDFDIVDDLPKSEVIKQFIIFRTRTK